MHVSLNPDVAIVLQNSVEIFCHRVSRWTYHLGIAFACLHNTTIFNRVQVFQM